MAELRCPHCGQAFTVDDTELSSIVKQIRDAEFERDLNERIDELKEHLDKEHKAEILQSFQNKIRRYRFPLPVTSVHTGCPVRERNKLCIIKVAAEY